MKRDGSVIELLGWYDPMAPDATKQLNVNADRCKYWIAKGAQPSDTVADLLAKLSIVGVDSRKKHHERRAKASQAGKAKAAELAAAAASAKKDEKKA